MGVASLAPVVVDSASAPQTKSELFPRIPALDGLRGMAVLSVLATHTIMLFSSDRINAVDRTFNLVLRFAGLFGLELFFVLSGFLITTILDRTRDAENSLITFYARRALRIVPLYYLYLIFIPILFSKGGPLVVGTPATRLWDFTFLTNVLMTQKTPEQIGVLFGHLWSLSIEEQFYIIWPVIVFVVPRRRLPRVCVLLVAFSVLLRVGLALIYKSQYGWLLLPTRLDALMGGSLIAIFAADNPQRLRDGARAIVWPMTAFSIAYLVMMIVGLWDSKADLRSTFATTHATSRVEIVAWPFLAALFFSCIVALTVTSKSSPRWVLARWLRLTGRYSYGLYLLHAPLSILLLVFGLPRRHPIGGFDFPYQIICIVLVGIVARTAGMITWNGFEKHVLKLAPAYRFRARERTSPVV